MKSKTSNHSSVQKSVYSVVTNKEYSKERESTPKKTTNRRIYCPSDS